MPQAAGPAEPGLGLIGSGSNGVWVRWLCDNQVGVYAGSIGSGHDAHSPYLHQQELCQALSLPRLCLVQKGIQRDRASMGPAPVIITPTLL